MRPSGLLLLILLSSSCTTSLAQLEEKEKGSCKPEGSANCTGAATNRRLSRVQQSVQLLHKELVSLLPAEEPTTEANLPSKTKFQKMHRAWESYVTSYCDVYWNLWPGATIWKSAESRSFLLGEYIAYQRYLEKLNACAKGDEAVCGQLAYEACSPTGCRQLEDDTKRK
ncbi:MAG TPA: hypothetical protein VK149_04865 [Sideroxyarcus sp.]|nr:hypothetical protein [Sideroxyarcus sp.]